MPLINQKRMAELLKDYRDYLAALIQKRNETDAKIKSVAAQIAALKETA